MRLWPEIVSVVVIVNSADKIAWLRAITAARSLRDCQGRSVAEILDERELATRTLPARFPAEKIW